jgi:hypothetical protein
LRFVVSHHPGGMLPFHLKGSQHCVSMCNCNAGCKPPGKIFKRRKVWRR